MLPGVPTGGFAFVHKTPGACLYIQAPIILKLSFLSLTFGRGSHCWPAMARLEPLSLIVRGYLGKALIYKVFYQADISEIKSRWSGIPRVVGIHADTRKRCLYKVEYTQIHANTRCRWVRVFFRSRPPISIFCTSSIKLGGCKHSRIARAHIGFRYLGYHIARSHPEFLATVTSAPP